MAPGKPEPSELLAAQIIKLFRVCEFDGLDEWATGLDDKNIVSEYEIGILKATLEDYSTRHCCPNIHEKKVSHRVQMLRTWAQPGPSGMRKRPY